VCVSVFAYNSRTDISICTKFGMLIPWERKEILDRSNSGKMSWVRVPVRAVPVARKLSKIERRDDRSCEFRRGDNRNKGHNPKTVWVRVSVKMSGLRIIIIIIIIIIILFFDIRRYETND
jgi:hypothetical protein